MNGMEQAEWCKRYSVLKGKADSICLSIRERARQACVKAGLDGNLLGIHPHNAMVSLEHGKPWDGVDYHYVRLCLHLQHEMWKPYRIVEAWDKRVRGY